MKISVTREHMGAFESIAITDIIMNLFIFFFVSFSLIYSLDYAKENRINIKLPKGGGVAAQNRQPPLTVTVTKYKEIYLGDNLIPQEKLEQAVRSAVGAKQDKTVYLRADDTLNYGFVIGILSKLHGSGAKVLALGVESGK
ncbi:MAG: biopolymer transporter ExbD [Elusimicrobiota bacterium]